MTLRVLHVLDHSLPLHSGYAFRTLAILREQRAQGWQTLQVTSPKQGATASERDVIDGWTFHRTAPPRGVLRALPGLGYAAQMNATRRSLERCIAEFRPDVLHAHSPVLTALPALAAGRRHGIPVVYEVRALWEDAAVDHGTTQEGSLRYRATRALETYALRRVDHVTTICEGLRGDIVGRGVDADRVTVIPNAVDADRFTLGAPADATLRRSLGLDSAKVIGFAGSFYAYEGLDLLLDAAARLLPARPDLRVLLVGGGPQDEALRAQARALGIAERVVFTGRVPQAEVQRYYSLIDVLAYPRRRMRLTDLVTPLKPLEAMAQGNMFVASDVGGHRELVRDGDTGWLCAADDVPALAGAIDRVLSSEDRWPQVRANARRFVESERTWARSVARYAAVYARVRRPGARGLPASATGRVKR